MYTTLAKMQAELKGTNVNATTSAEQQLMMYGRTVTDRIRAYKFEFEPLFYTRKITPCAANVNSRAGILTLGDDLLEPTAITVGTQTLTYGTDILPYPNNSMFPIRQLRIASLCCGPIRSWYPCCIQPDQYFESISITGFWGMREYYSSQGFFSSGVVSPVMTSTQPTIVVSDVAGPDIYNNTPLFSAGNLIRFDDDTNELSEIVKVDTGTKTLTLIRGARGTTAAAHLVSTPILIWQPEDDIVNAATRQACLLYARRGAYQQVTSYPDGVNVTYPSDLLAEIRATIQRFNYVGNW